MKKNCQQVIQKKKETKITKNPLKSSKKNCVSRIKQAMIINKYNHK